MLILRNRPEFPSDFSPDAINLITGFLQTESSQRLGAHGFKEVFDHPFFKTIDWEAMMKMEVESPIKVKIVQ